MLPSSFVQFQTDEERRLRRLRSASKRFGLSSSDDEDDGDATGIFFDPEKDKHARGTAALTAMCDALDDPDSKLARLVSENEELASLLEQCREEEGLS